MYPLLTVAQMRQCDEYTIHQRGIPSQTLMERAAATRDEDEKRKVLTRAMELNHMIKTLNSGKQDSR